MSEIINTNMPSLVAQGNLDTSNSRMATCLQRLSSGLRINSAKDDAAGLSIATRMASSISGLTVAKRNANDAISLAQIAEGALQETTTVLQRARELAVQSANGTNAATDRQALQAEINQIQGSMSSIASTTSFNGLNLLDGSLAATQFQVGAMANQTVVVSIANTQTNALGAQLLTSNNTDTLQANYETYYEATAVAIKPASATNGVVDTSTIAFTGINNTGSTTVLHTVAPVAAQTADSLAAAINGAASLAGSAQASAYTAVALSTLATTAGNTITIGINNANGAAQATQAIASTNIGGTAAETYSNVATLINSNLGMQQNGIYAIASANDVVVISPTGADIYVTSSNAAATVGSMQLLNTDGVALGNSVAVANASACAAGILSLEVEENTTVAFGDANLFANSNPAITGGGGVRASQTTNRVAQQTLTIAGGQGSAQVDLQSNATAYAAAQAVNAVTGSTGVTATALTTAVITGLSENGTVSFQLADSDNDLQTVSAYVTTEDLTALVQAINQISGKTGILAQSNGTPDSILLTDNNGYDIKILNFNHSEAVTAPTVSDTSFIYGDGNGNVSGVADSSAQTLALPSYQYIEVMGNSNSGGITLYAGGGRHNINSTVIGGVVNFEAPTSFAVSSSVKGDSATSYQGSILKAAINTAVSATFTTVSEIDISTVEGAQTAIVVIDQAISQISAIRSNLGAIQSRFESTIRNLSNNIENLQSAKSRIMDADFADETSELTKAQILTQAGISILAQANAIPQGVLQLLS
jgi:flagellin